MNPGKLPKVRASKVTGIDGFIYAVETCPYCAQPHFHRKPDLERPRACHRTGREYLLAPGERPNP